MAGAMLSADHHRQIMEAVAAAEAKTRGEIACILAQEVSAYPETTIAWAAGAALVLPPLGLFIGLRPDVIDAALGGWSVAHPAAGSGLMEMLGGYAIAQGVIFGVVAALLTFMPKLRRALTPPAVKRRRVKLMALQHFLAMGVHQDESRTGVLIFAALGEHQVEIVADKAIHEKVGQTAWNEAAGAVVAGMRGGEPGEGFVRAVQICGAALATHYPSRGKKANALPDRLVEL